MKFCTEREKKYQLDSSNILEVIDFTLMQNSSCFRAPLKSEGGHGSQTLLKPVREHFYRNFPLVQDKLSWKIYF